MMIENIKLSDLKRNAVYCYVDEENKKIREVKVNKLISENSGYFLVTGKIKIPDGAEYPALIGISSDDSGELFEAHIYINNEWVSQGDEDFLKKLNKKKNQVFPYKYHLNVKVNGDENTINQY